MAAYGQPPENRRTVFIVRAWKRLLAVAGRQNANSGRMALRWRKNQNHGAAPDKSISRANESGNRLMCCIKCYIAAISALLLIGGPARAANCGPDLKPTDNYRALSGKLKCLEDQIKALEGGAAASTGSAAPARASGAPAPQEAGGLRIEAEGCQKTGKVIACKMFVTSLEDDREVDFRTASNAVDSNGVQYSGLGYQGVGEPNMESQPWSIRRNFISNVRTACVMFFKAAQDHETSALAALRLRFMTDDASRAVTIRNIPVQ
jgi:hypothetical protein